MSGVRISQSLRIFMGVPKSWRSSSVRKTDGYAFDGPNPSTPTILYSTLAQLVEQSAVNRQVPGSNPGGGAIIKPSVPIRTKHRELL